MNLRISVQDHSVIRLERKIKARLPSISNVNLRTVTTTDYRVKETMASS